MKSLNTEEAELAEQCAEQRGANHGIHGRHGSDKTESGRKKAQKAPKERRIRRWTQIQCKHWGLRELGETRAGDVKSGKRKMEIREEFLFGATILWALPDQVGAKLVKDATPISPAEWCLETALGKLSITVYDNWVACRFEDHKRASKVVNCNPHSGKWNHHVGELTSMEHAKGIGEYVVKQLMALKALRTLDVLPELPE